MSPRRRTTPSRSRGTGRFARLRSTGGQRRSDLVKSFRCHFDEKTYRDTADKEVIEEGSYTIDASKTPKTIDFDIKKGPKEGKRQLGIYKIEGDKITLVMTQAGSTTRPKAFKAESGDSLVEVVLERVKP